jgi:SnoaL-like domain
VTESTSVGERLLAAITARDYDTIADCFADGGRFDVLTPHQLRRHATPAAAADRYRYWLDKLDGFEMLEQRAVPIADRLRIRYLFRGRDPGAGWQLNEHTAYAAVEDGRIASMTLTCAGFRPTSPPRS